MIIICDTEAKLNAALASDPTSHVWRDGAVWRVYTGADKPDVVIPQSVTMRQARLALLQYGLLAHVNSAVAAMSGAQGDAARIEWEFSSEVHRNRPFVASLSASLGLSPAQLDALFTLAATL